MLFLSDYQYDLGTDQLVPFGADHARYTGAEAFERYRDLLMVGDGKGERDVPFVRASGKQRVIDSATNWTLGFAQASQNAYIPKLNVVLNEKANDTLDNSQCPNAGDADLQVDEWVATYAHPIAQRLSTLAPGSNLTAADIYGLMLICPFESVAHLSQSPFCSLFTPSEFSQFEYAFDLDKYYGTGYGQPLGRVQGVGYVNELLARLEGREVRDGTQTNRTLDGERETFPLDRKVYVDFSHDNQLVAIYGAVGLFPQYRALDPLNPDRGRDWVAARMVPFSARMVVERLVCQVDGEGEYVRIFVNDALQPLKFCGADADEGEEGDGLCELGAFVKSQKYARHNGEGDWEACFEESGPGEPGLPDPAT
ncbi:hypothetical protein AX17_006082 [Amanita inopinata Kibby_2008]|nr:hypothetical protein AX17_006082 [Amanita inopinata Kibby_2008]